jgi:hypothetical protein
LEILAMNMVINPTNASQTTIHSETEFKMRITRKTSLWVAAAAVLTSLPVFAGEGDVGVARITNTTQPVPAAQATQPVPMTQVIDQGCLDGGCTAAPIPDATCGPGGCLPGNSGGSTGWNSRRTSSNGSSTKRRLSSLMGSRGRGLGSCGNGGGPCGWWRGQVNARRARNARASQALKNILCPSGNCGRGAPLVGHYNMVYAADPNYFDQRDGSLYSAQGYGTPVTVPLAPNVHHQFNYGWGIPSSRITQISTPAGYSVQRPIHW